MQFSMNEAPDKVVLWPIAFISKSLTIAYTYYSNIEREAIGILFSLENSTTTALPIGQHDNRQQSACRNF